VATPISRLRVARLREDLAPDAVLGWLNRCMGEGALDDAQVRQCLMALMPEYRQAVH
jgi:hypothetical protein